MDFSKIKKEVSLFLNSEEAKVLKKDIAKIGLTASVIAAIMHQITDAQAQHSEHDDNPHTDAHTSGHEDHDQHLDSTEHTDGSHDDHTDGVHGDHDNHTQHSSQPVYDGGNKRGGHSSQMIHADA
jgi:hypothetical protein